MTGDLLDDLLNLEDNYYQEGYDLGQADGAHAGLVEGKLFGLEKGFEKVMSMGRLSGQGDVWRQRFQPSNLPSSEPLQVTDLIEQDVPVSRGGAPDGRVIVSARNLPPLAGNSRLGKHIDSLMAMTDAASLSSINSDEAVAEFDERLAKAMAKAKVISNIIAEPLHFEDAPNKGHRSIEESGSLSARH